MKTFTSKQTGSEYTLVSEFKDFIVGLRNIGGNDFRIRVESQDASALATIKEALASEGFRVGITGSDHISLVVTGVEQASAKAAAAVNAVVSFSMTPAPEVEPEPVVEEIPEKVKVDLDLDAIAPSAEFTSPQTGSVYTVVARHGSAVVSQRNLNGWNRVRIQCDDLALLEKVLGIAAENTIEGARFHYGETGVGHISVTVATKALADALAIAVQAIVKAQQ